MKLKTQKKDMKLRKYDKKEKLFFLIFYLIISLIFVYFVKPTYLISILVVLVFPSILNFLYLKKSRKKIFLFSLISTFLFAFPVELLSRNSNLWDVESILPRIFGILPLENLLFAFLNFFWVLSFYEYFTDEDKTKKFSKKFKFLIFIFCIFLFIILYLFFYNKNLLIMSYFELAFIILLIPSLILIIKKPKLLQKTFFTTMFFAVFFFIYEIISLLNKNWWWPSEYFITINIFGNLFPLDDVIIWYFLSTITLILGYEFFMDDFN